MSELRATTPFTAPKAPRQFEAFVTGVAHYGEAVTELRLASATGDILAHRPGQYLSVILEDGARRSYSMAAPSGGDIELHIQRRPGGRFSDLALAGVKVGDKFRLEGPFGEMDWQRSSGQAVLLGTGTGLAPLKALVQQGLAAGFDRPIRLYWGGRTLNDLYLAPALRRWAREHVCFTFVPVLSRPHAGWSGRVGYVQDAAAADLTTLSDTAIYACGPPAMVAAARSRLAVIKGYDDGRFFADAFEPADGRAPAGASKLWISADIAGDTRRLEAASGSTLLAALRAAGAPILSICGGRASCAACKVTIEEPWRDRLPAPGRTERRLLAFLDDAGPHDRLACQIQLTAEADGLAVRLGPETTALSPA